MHRFPEPLVVLDAAGAPRGASLPHLRTTRAAIGQTLMRGLIALRMDTKSPLAQASAGHLERWLEVGGQGIAPRTLPGLGAGTSPNAFSLRARWSKSLSSRGYLGRLESASSCWSIDTGRWYR